jgi:hypothetical protein
MTEETSEAREIRTRAALDAAIREHAADELLSDGEVIVAWIGLAAVIRHDGGGVVITMPGPGEALPIWQMRGILAEAAASVDRQARRNEEQDDG